MRSQYHHLTLSSASLVALTTALLGCAQAPIAKDRELPAPSLSQPKQAPVYLRQGRYALLELGATDLQKDLLLQVIDINLPPGLVITVGDAIRYVLLNSGFRLCSSANQALPLLSLPIPASHIRLGPMSLHEALETLSGPAWRLEIDERLREVCFVDHPGLVPDGGEA